MEIYIVSLLITLVFAIYFIVQYTSLSDSKLKNKEAKRVLAKNADIKYQQQGLNSITYTQGLSVVKKRTFFSIFSKKDKKSKYTLIAQSKPTATGWL